MTPVTSIILRQMRAPLIVLIMVFATSTLGMTLIPGVDENGNPWRMDFFHALYFVSYTATTIGFGEIPYALTDAQRLWVLITIFFSVIGWFYAIGKIVSLVQSPLFKNAVVRANFKRAVDQLDDDFYLVCGYGETGQDLVQSLTSKRNRVVVIDDNEDAIETLEIQDYISDVPALEADASIPEQLQYAGLERTRKKKLSKKEPFKTACKAVIAVTNSDKINLKIAITSKLLHPETTVICRTEHSEYDINMRSFNTDYTVNPYDTFAHNFEMALKAPAMHLLNEWLTGVPDTLLCDPVIYRDGHWILCGYGRLGQRLYKILREHKSSVTIIDTRPQLEYEFKAKYSDENTHFIVGTGTDAETLNKAGIKKAVGLIAGSDNDSNNLSCIMTAHVINNDTTIIARQNELINRKLFLNSSTDVIMHPSEIVARRIRTLLINPRLIDFLEACYARDEAWINITISKISGAIGDLTPHCWTNILDLDNSPAICSVLNKGRHITLANILQNPLSRRERIHGICLMVKRGSKLFLLPDESLQVQSNDEVLFCGTEEAEIRVSHCMNDIHVLNYVTSQESSPDSFIGRLLTGQLHKKRRKRDYKH